MRPAGFRAPPATLLLAAALGLGVAAGGARAVEADGTMATTAAEVEAGGADAAAAACPGGDAGLPPLSLAASLRALNAGQPIIVLAFGSSSTEGSGASSPDRTYPARLEARLRAAMPGVPLAVLNRGRGGEDVQEMLARLDREVLALRPSLVIWQAGANAVLKGMAPEAFGALMAEGLSRLRAGGADVVLMDSQRAPRILASPNHPVFDALMQSLARDRQVPLFSRAELMRRWEAAGAPNAEFLVEDGLHHNDRGYDCLAAALAGLLVDALHPPATVAGRR
jgi:lysophospholipase L1-like esterase